MQVLLHLGQISQPYRRAIHNIGAEITGTGEISLQIKLTEQSTVGKTNIRAATPQNTTAFVHQDSKIINMPWKSLRSGAAVVTIRLTLTVNTKPVVLEHHV